MKKAALLFLALGLFVDATAQFPRFSLNNDLGIQKSFREEQEYFAVGHTVHALFHTSPKEALYAWISYYSDGKFHNNVTAVAKSPLTIPQQQPYTNRASMRFKHFSLGYRRYLRGHFEQETGWTLYGYGGFGIMLGRVINTHDPEVDSNLYVLPVRSGKANFKRLTLDLGLGVETPIGADTFFYSEIRVWVPTTNYPSKHIFVNNNAPFTGMLNLGIRILF